MKGKSTLKALGLCAANPFRVKSIFRYYPRLSLRSNLGLKLANAFGVKRPQSRPESGTQMIWLANPQTFHSTLGPHFASELPHYDRV